MISLEEVKKLALLARIEMTEKEQKKLQKDLEAILDYVGQLKKAPLDTNQAGAVSEKIPEIFNVFRKDEQVGDESDIEKGEHIRVKHIL